MSSIEGKTASGSTTASPWEGFRGALWQKEVNVRAFIQLNYTPYEGEASFLAPATARTTALWARLSAMFVEERKKGVLDISQVPSSITAHAPGYIDREHEIIVGLQTDAPLKRAIMPNGGLRMVLNAMEAYGYTPDPHVVEAFTKYRKTHNEGVFDAVHRRHSGLPQFALAHRAAGRVRAWAHHRRLPPVAALRRGPADRGEEAGEAGA
jgi:formate C-acetyltransferase